MERLDVVVPVLVTVPVEVSEGLVVRDGVTDGVTVREGVGEGEMGTPKSAKESTVTVPTPVEEPKHALIHTEGRLSRIPVVAGMAVAGQTWKLPAIDIVALADTEVQVEPLFTLYQNWYGIVFTDTFA